MNRTGLIVALSIGLVVGLICAVDPQLDLDIAGLTFDPSWKVFGVNAQPWVQHSRDAARLVIGLLALPAFIAVLAKLAMPNRPMLIEGRSALFLIATLALGPGVLTNVIFKEHWARARPIDVQQFGGTDRFTPWWDPRGDCADNCSFIAGEPSGAFGPWHRRRWRRWNYSRWPMPRRSRWRQRRRAARCRRGAFLFRRRLCRRVHLPADMGGVRLHLSLARDPHQRGRDRELPGPLRQCVARPLLYRWPGWCSGSPTAAARRAESAAFWPIDRLARAPIRPIVPANFRRPALSASGLNQSQIRISRCPHPAQKT